MNQLCEVCPLRDSQFSSSEATAFEQVMFDSSDQEDQLLLAATDDQELADAIALADRLQRCDPLFSVLPPPPRRLHRRYNACAQVRLVGKLVAEIVESPDFKAS